MTDFMTEHYLLIILVATFIIFALIGYVIDTTKNKKGNSIPNKEANQAIDITQPVIQSNQIPEVEVNLNPNKK